MNAEAFLDCLGLACCTFLWGCLIVKLWGIIDNDNGENEK